MRELTAAAASEPSPNFLNNKAPKGAKVWYSNDGPVA
tara:strand:- start:83 stop:193 length:111 start_codon:yes stop_codon:yes gene_type:complete